MDHHHALVEQPEFVHVAHERPAELFLAEHALQPGFEDVDIERQVVPLAQFGQAAKVFDRHPLRGRAGHRRGESPVRRAMPPPDEVLIQGQ